MKRLFLVPALAVAALALSIPAHAQSAGWRDADQLGYAQRPYLDSQRAAYDNGFREGLKQGERDGRRNTVARYQDERTYQRADNGYHREYGPIERYRQSFRSGYSAGYSDGYRRYGRTTATATTGAIRAGRATIAVSGGPLRQPGAPERRERRVREGRRGRAQEPGVRPAPPLVVPLRRSSLRRRLRLARSCTRTSTAGGSPTGTTVAIAKGDTGSGQIPNCQLPTPKVSGRESCSDFHPAGTTQLSW